MNKKQKMYIGLVGWTFICYVAGSIMTLALDLKVYGSWAWFFVLLGMGLMIMSTLFEDLQEFKCGQQ